MRVEKTSALAGTWTLDVWPEMELDVMSNITHGYKRPTCSGDDVMQPP